VKQLDIWPTPIIFLHKARAHGSTQSNRVKVSSLLEGHNPIECVVPDILKNHSAFIFMALQARKM